MHRGTANKWSFYAVLGVKIGCGHDFTSNAILGCFELEFWDGTCRCDNWAQHWEQCFNVKTAHFWCYWAQNETNWAKKHTKAVGNLAFSGGGEMDEIDWNFYETIPAPKPIVSTGFHPLGHQSGTMCKHAKHYRPGQRLVGSVRGEKMSTGYERVTLWHANKMHRWQWENLSLNTNPHSNVIRTPSFATSESSNLICKALFSCYFWGQHSGQMHSQLLCNPKIYYVHVVWSCDLFIMRLLI